MTNEGGQREPIEELAEEFIARLRRGDRPSLSDYVERHPDLAPRIRDLFPTLVMMERFGDPESSSLDGLGEQAADGTPARQLGEYRILREIGRGGMGVVYEAEQESLGRHVALKVLASHWRLDEKQLKRFQREARAVAKLQHPHIVPVYGIYEHKGVPYYVMQFIRGQGLDAVLQELRGLTSAQHGPGAVEDKPPTVASQVARRLVQVGHSGLAAGAESIDLGNTDLHQQPVDHGHDAGEADRSCAKSTIAALPRQTEAVARSSSGIYFQSVVRMGVQVADALAYAHEQGILHRDIKPSNLLVDAGGAVWITDFGLAKATTEDNLTDSGDVVGTLRYMAPEQLRGWADPRSDVYGLGITLYELLALRPAFLATDRAQLMSQVLGENPPRLRKLCRNVPFDLETIIHKAVAKEPEQRYVSAGELGADLRRFMEGQPIRARRPSVTKWLWLWSRRNPLVAALLLCLFLILTSALGLVTFLWRDAELERQAVTTKNVENRQLLGEAYLAEARALRGSRRPERRREALEVLARASAIRPSVEARNEAIAALAQPGLELVRRWQPPNHAYLVPCFTLNLERYASVQGRILTIRSTVDDEILVQQELQDPAIPAEGVISPGVFLPAGRIFLSTTRQPGSVHVFIWDVNTGKARWVSPSLAAPTVSYDRDVRYVALGRAGQIEIHDVEEQRVVRTIETTTATAIGRLVFQPGGPLLAGATREGEVHLYDWRTGTVVSRMALTEGIADLNWSPDGQYLAAGCVDYRTYIWNCEDKEVPLRAVLTAHQAEVVRSRFSPDGRYLATSSWDGTTILWETRGLREVLQLPPSKAVPPVRAVVWEMRGLREVLQLPGALAGFSADGQRFITSNNLDASYCLWSLRQPTGVTRVEGHLSGGKGPKQVDVSPDGRLLASASADGVRLWDLARKKQLKHLPSTTIYCVCFHPSGRELLASGSDGVRAWPLTVGRADEAGDLTVEIGPLQAFAEPSEFSRIALDATGRTLALANWSRRQTLLYTDSRRAEPRLLMGHAGVREVALSPDGRWLATATWHGRGVRIWNGQTGDLVEDIYPQSDSAIVAFSPDGRWFAAGNGPEYRLWEVDGWKLRHTFDRNQGGNLPGPIAFSRDGQIMAIAPTIHAVRLVRTETGEEIATLGGPNLDILTWLCFTPDGAQLVCGTENQIIQIWDFRELNDALAPLRLNWM